MRNNDRSEDRPGLAATGYPNETSGLLTADGSVSHIDVINMKRQRYWRPILNYTMITLVLVAGANMIYDDYFHNPDRVEHRLVKNFEALANQSMKLLNDLTESALKDDSLDNQNNHAMLPKGCECTVLILRHCEDLGGHVRYEDGSSHCSYLGFQRSLYLATLFGNTTADGIIPRWPFPSHLYGMWNQDGTNKRQYELLRPLSDKSGVPIEMFNFEHAASSLRSKLFDMLSQGQLCHEVVVVAWKHKFIRLLAAILGCDQEKGCPGGHEFGWDDYDFDTVWELQYVYQPEALRAFPHNQSVQQHKRERLVEDWKVFGSVTREYFDALAFKRDYYNGERNDSNNWMEHGHL